MKHRSRHHAKTTMSAPPATVDTGQLDVINTAQKAGTNHRGSGVYLNR